MLVEHIMTKHVVSISMDATLETIRDLFNHCNFHHLVVVDDKKIVGVVSDRDLLRAISPFAGTASERTIDAACLRKRAHQIMSRAVIAARPDMDASEAAMILINKRISCLPVTNDAGACLGIVTWRDLLRWSLEQFAERMKSAA